MKQIKTVIVTIIALFIFLVIGILFPYLIQFEFKMFGANMITFRDILGLWIGFISTGIASACIFFVATK